MSQQVTVVITDDLDGSITTYVPTGTPVQAVRFAIDGEAYEIHLGEQNAAKLRAVYAPYIAHGRRRGTVPEAARFRVVGGAEARAAREWAISQGMAVSRKGRVPAGVIDRYHAAAQAGDPVRVQDGCD